MKDNKKTCSKCEERAIHCHGFSDNEVFFCQKHEDEYQAEKKKQKENNETIHCDKCNTDIVKIDFETHSGKACETFAEIEKYKSQGKKGEKESLCQSCQNELNVDLEYWEKNRKRIKAEAVKCDGSHSGHNSTSIRYYNAKGEYIGRKRLREFKMFQCDNTNCDRYISLSDWDDRPPCACSKSNKKEPVESQEIKKFDDKLPDKLEPTKAKEVEKVEKLLSLDQVEEYFIRENISKIERKDGRLIITFTDEKNVNKNTLTIKEQQKLSQFLATSNLKELSSEDLSKRMGSSSKSQRNNPNRISPAWFIFGGIGLLFIIGIVWKIIKNKKPA